MFKIACARAYVPCKYLNPLELLMAHCRKCPRRVLIIPDEKFALHFLTGEKCDKISLFLREKARTRE